MLQRKEVDIGATDFHSNHARSKVVDLSTILFYDRYKNQKPSIHIGSNSKIWDRRSKLLVLFLFVDLPKNYWYQLKGCLSRNYFSK